MLTFWYEFASTYSYPAAMRIERLAAEAGVAVDWRPLLIGPLFHEQQGLTDSPFNSFPVKGAYMWRDLERVCSAEGLPLRRPSQFPRNGLLAARIAVVGLDDGWTPAFSQAVYQANFVDDQDISDPAVLIPLIASVGAGPEHVLAAANSDPVKARLKQHVAQARDQGVFGAPSFVTADGELFWGNDRLEQALDWAVKHQSREHA
ncbi:MULTISPECIES: 2-hydroxychromene-2-carboxylate isomerase [unclassified Caulobacter]|uniref:2-hydroxychromene-2-carboxylate isomerase n=1 Tax=unclassified Caulobacter TaxID=2648921 RepID=UPI000D345D18|nr:MULTISPECIES: 2-hydroxychromene-2-carboxylate isomerase [unclassified Caulobacter]PTS89755.1 2-hydroxychromene-2-carboxylate isomerase [Caulobacter sp. HMWF009]PTT05068.1 2-hydroxychromene-2-carboxylate isomerase [Caulobacter sp. HMWF025]